MAINKVGKIAPFINDVFTITSPWWTLRNGVIHRGLDIATSGSKPVYSMLTGIIHSKGSDDSQGNWVVIKDSNPASPYYGYATLYMHLAEQTTLNIGDSVTQGQYIAMEGSTGNSTGIHLHVEMQDLNRWNNVWHWSYIQSDYLDPTEFMGIDNIDQSQWLYDGTPYIPPSPDKRKDKFKWVLYARKLRNKN